MRRKIVYLVRLALCKRPLKRCAVAQIAVEYVTDKDIELVGELSGETNKNPAEDDPFSMPPVRNLREFGVRAFPGR